MYDEPEYDENKANEIVALIRDNFIAAFTVLEETLKDKIEEANTEL